MALTDEQIRKIRSGIENYSNQELDIPDNEKDDFWKWVKKDANLYQPASLDNIENLNYTGRCFDVAQKVYKKKHKDYYEGFYELNNEIIFHGFNVANGNVEDYTLKRDLDKFKKNDQNKTPKIIMELRFLKN